MVDNLFRLLRPFEHTAGLTGRRIDVLHRTTDTASHKKALPVNHETAGQLTGATLQGPELTMPFGDRLLPQDCPIEGIPRNQLPVGRQLNGNPGTLVHDVEYPASS